MCPKTSPQKYRAITDSFVCLKASGNPNAKNFDMQFTVLHK